MKTQLQLLRKKAGYKSAREFAEKNGYNPGSYTNYEQGVRNLSLEQAWEFADIFDCSLDELAGRKRPYKELPDPSEQELVDCYRASTNDRKDRILDTARDAAVMSKDASKPDISSSSQVSA